MSDNKKWDVDPDGFAHRYPDGIRYGSYGQTINGMDPTETIPIYWKSSVRQIVASELKAKDAEIAALRKERETLREALRELVHIVKWNWQDAELIPDDHAEFVMKAERVLAEGQPISLSEAVYRTGGLSGPSQHQLGVRLGHIKPVEPKAPKMTTEEEEER